MYTINYCKKFSSSILNFKVIIGAFPKCNYRPDRQITTKQWHSGFASRNCCVHEHLSVGGRERGERVQTTVSLIKTFAFVHKRNFSIISQSTNIAATKKKMAKLNEQERTEQLQPLLNNGWSLVKDRDAIYKEYIFTDFNQAFRFMTGVALLAEKLNHHPEWFNVYNKVQVTMSTHDVGGLSAKDIRVANYMDQESKRYT